MPGSLQSGRGLRSGKIELRFRDGELSPGLGVFRIQLDGLLKEVTSLFHMLLGLANDQGAAAQISIISLGVPGRDGRDLSLLATGEMGFE